MLFSHQNQQIDQAKVTGHDQCQNQIEYGGLDAERISQESAPSFDSIWTDR